MKDWEKKLKKQIAEDLYIVTFDGKAFTARKVNGVFFNSVTGEELKTPNIYRSRKI